MLAYYTLLVYDLEFATPVVGLRPQAYYTLTNFRGEGAFGPPQYANGFYFLEKIFRKSETFRLLYLSYIILYHYDGDGDGDDGNNNDSDGDDDDDNDDNETFFFLKKK